MKILSYSEARKIAYAKINIPSKDPLVIEADIVDSATIEDIFGWVFIYTSKLFIETQDPKYRLLGNLPILVNKFTGEMKELTLYYEKDIEVYRNKFLEEYKHLFEG